MPEQSERYWFARNAKPTLFVLLVLTCVGVYLAFSVPVAVFPETNFPRIVIGVDNGVMPIEQMQVTITRPIEEAVNSIPGLVSVRSITSRGSAEVDLFFNWNIDMFQTLQRVDSILSRADIPTTAKVDTHRLTFASFPIVGYSLTSNTVPQTRLWEIATYDMKPRLNRLTGVATVVVQGGKEPEYRIAPNPAKLLVAGITIPDILEAVRRSNTIGSPGLLEQNHQLVLGLVSGQVHSPEELAQLVIKTTPTGVPVRIGDVATVSQDVKPVYTVVTANGKPAVLLNISRQPEGNTVQVADEVAAEMDVIRKTLPAGIQLVPFYDQSSIVRASINSVRDAIFLGLVLASGVIVLFLRDWGSSLVAGMVIPITICITFISFRIFGLTFNLMTLGGLAAAVGLVIDDAIVVVENIVLHRDSGQPRLEAIRSALREITVPLIGSTITPIVVFLPLISTAGVTGSFFRALATTMTVALLTSLVLALTWTPNMSQFFIRKSGPDEVGPQVHDEPDELKRLLAAEEASMSGRFGKVVAHYEQWLKWTLEHPRSVMVGCLILIGLSYGCYRLLGTGLLPKMDEGGFIVDYIMPAGSSLTETNRVVSHIEAMLKELPEVESTSRRTGLQLGLAAVTEANTGDIAVKLRANRKRSSDAVMADMLESIQKEEPAVKVEIIQLLQDMIADLSNAPEEIRINLFSPDPALLATWGPKVADAISKQNGVVEVLNGIENTLSGPAISYQVNPVVAGRSGFTPEEVATDATALLEGQTAAAPMIVNGKPYAIRVRAEGAEQMDSDKISNTLLVSSTGKTATLGSLATVTTLPGQTEIRRENQQLVINVTGRLNGVDLGTGVAEVQRAVSSLNLPPSIRVQYGGQYQEQQQTFHDLATVLGLALVFIFGVLLFEFRDFAAPTAIVTSALMSTSGVLFALLVTRLTFNVSSFMGLIMVVGIVAKNGILLLDADKKFRAFGMNAEDAMIQAGRRRLRPITMTALASIAGMLPLAFALGAGSEMLQPLAVAVIGGVLISMALSLLLTPTINYYLTKEAKAE